MFYRKLHWVLTAVVVAVAVIQIVTGNLAGAILPLILAVIFASIAADRPILKGARRVWKWLRRLLWILPLVLMPHASARAEDAPKPALILLYNGLGTTAGARMWGRVVEDPGLAPPSKAEGRLGKLLRTFKLMESDEIPGAWLELKVLGRKLKAKSDSEGFFRVDIKGPLKQGDHKVSARLIGTGRPNKASPGRLKVWSSEPGVAVISDMDDTLLRTGVTNKARMLKRVIFSNALDLRSFGHAPALYRAWARRGYPLVFVSGSPYNLYPRLARFMKLQGLPASPLLLKDFGTDALTEQVAYKLKKISEVMALLPGYRFILVGDSGEKDPEVYRAVQAKKPKAVMVTLIHRVTNEGMRDPRFKGQVLFNFYSGLARVLARLGLLSAAEVKQVEAAP